MINNNLSFLDMLVFFNTALNMFNTERFNLQEEHNKAREAIEDARYLELKTLMLNILEKLDETK